jgi:hypothetical protein
MEVTVESKPGMGLQEGGLAVRQSTMPLQSASKRVRLQTRTLHVARGSTAQPATSMDIVEERTLGAVTELDSYVGYSSVY